MASAYHFPHVARAMRAAGLPVIISGGTALGFIRECRMIPKDPDIDLWLLHSHLNTTEQAIAFANRFEEASQGRYKVTPAHRYPEYAGFQFTIVTVGV